MILCVQPNNTDSSGSSQANYVCKQGVIYAGEGGRVGHAGCNNKEHPINITSLHPPRALTHAAAAAVKVADAAASVVVIDAAATSTFRGNNEKTL